MSNKNFEEILLKVEKQLEEDLRNRKRGNVLKLIIAGILAIWLISSIMFMINIYNLFKSQQFLDALQYKSIQVWTDLLKKAATTAQKTAPDIYQKLKADIDKDLPQIADRIKNEYIPQFLERITEETKKSANEVIDLVEKRVKELITWELANIINSLEPSTLWLENLSPDQFEELKKDIEEKIDENVRTILESELKSHLEACVQQWKDAIEKIANIWTTTKYADLEDLYLEIFKTFINTIEYMKQGK